MSRNSVRIVAVALTVIVAATVIVGFLFVVRGAVETVQVKGFSIDSAAVRIPVAGAAAGAAYLVIRNLSDDDDRLRYVRSNAARRTELHSHLETDGVVAMRPVEDGFPIPAGGTLELAPGGDHVMLMGLEGQLGDGDSVLLTLVFEVAGEIDLDIPVRTGPPP